ncbi:MAG: AAA family ATPase, partial [Bacteroidetes bacterium]
SQQAHCFDFSSDCRTLRDESRQRTAAPGNAIHTRPNNVRDVPNRPKDGLLPPEFGGPELTFIPKAAYGRDKRYHTGKAMLQIEAGEEETSLIRGLLRQQSVNFLFGEEGSGKSLLAMNLAISVATGASRFLEFDICTHGKTLYLNNELPFREFLARFKTMAEALPEQQAERLTQLLVPENVPQFESYWDEINELCRTEKPALVVLDCLYWSHNRGENNSSGMKAILRQFTSLRDAHKLALLILHHTNKGSRYRGLHNNNMRGSGVFGAASDTTLELRRSEKDETKRLFKPTKLRYNNDAMRSPRLLSLADNSLWFVDNGAADEDEHIAKAQTSKEEINLTEIVQQGETLTREEILKRCMAMGFSERTVDRNLKQAKKTGLLKSPRKGVYVG